MSLSPEVTYEYYFRNPSLYFCREHGCLRVTDDHEDSVLLNGVTEANIDTFIQFYQINVKDAKLINKEELKELLDEEEVVEGEGNYDDKGREL